MVVGVVTLVASMVPLGAQLYAQVYPGQQIIKTPEDLEIALRDATVKWSFEPNPMLANEAGTVLVDVELLGEDPDPEDPTVKVAYQTKAQLRPRCLDATEVCAEVNADVAPTDWQTRYLRDGLHWEWTVTPRSPGEQTLDLEIQPVLVFEGGTSNEDLEKVNRSIPIAVLVHPVEEAWTNVLDAAEDLDTEVPNGATVGSGFDVTASFKLPESPSKEDVDDVDVDLSLDVEEGEASIEPGKLVRTGEAVRRDWRVTVTEQGTVDLKFLTVAKATVGDRSKQEEAAVTRSVVAKPSWVSTWWKQIVGIVSVVAAVSGIYYEFDRRRKAKRAEAAAAAAGGGPTVEEGP